jgi:hypothetical protein
MHQIRTFMNPLTYRFSSLHHLSNISNHSTDRG